MAHTINQPNVQVSTNSTCIYPWYRKGFLRKQSIEKQAYLSRMIKIKFKPPKALKKDHNSLTTSMTREDEKNCNATNGN